MGMPEELAALNWFMNHCPDVFAAGSTVRNGTLVEDWNGIDAWVDLAGGGSVSVGVRNHGDSHVYREFRMRGQIVKDDGQKIDAEFLKRVRGEQGPTYYLQVWRDATNSIIEYVFVDMAEMCKSGCFVWADYRTFWNAPDEFKEKGQRVFWSPMPVKRLLGLKPPCVVRANVRNRVPFDDPEIDQHLHADDPVEHYQVPPP